MTDIDLRVAFWIISLRTRYSYLLKKHTSYLWYVKFPLSNFINWYQVSTARYEHLLNTVQTSKCYGTFFLFKRNILVIKYYQFNECICKAEILEM